MGTHPESLELLDPAKLEREFLSLKSYPEDWNWLRQLNLLLMALAFTHPERCVEICQKYFPKTNEMHHYALTRIMVIAYRELGRFDSAVKWQ